MESDAAGTVTTAPEQPGPHFGPSPRRPPGTVATGYDAPPLRGTNPMFTFLAAAAPSTKVEGQRTESCRERAIGTAQSRLTNSAGWAPAVQRLASQAKLPRNAKSNTRAKAMSKMTPWSIGAEAFRRAVIATGVTGRAEVGSGTRVKVRNEYDNAIMVRRGVDAIGL